MKAFKVICWSSAAALLLLVYGIAYAVVPTGVLSQDGSPAALHCLMSTAFGFAGDSGYDCSKLRIIATGQIDLYASPTGNDTNNGCTNIGSPCTAQGAVNAAYQKYDYRSGSGPYIHLANGTYTSGIYFAGQLPAGGGTRSSPLPVTVVGAGSGITVVQPSPANCGTTPSALTVGGAYVRVGSFTASTQCTGGVGVQGYQNAVIELADGGFQLGGGGFSMVYLVANSLFTGASNFNLSMFGTVTDGCFTASINSTVLLSANAVLGFTGGVSCSTFIDLIDGSMWDPGIHSQINTNGFTFFNGTKYSISQNSHIDLEDMHVDAIPGTIGNIANNSVFFSNDGYTGICTQTLFSCPGSNAPTGIGAAGDVRFQTGNVALLDKYGAGDTSGSLWINASSGATASGDIWINMPSITTGPGHQGGSCTANYGMFHGNNWAAAARAPRTFYIAGVLQIHWDNLVALTPGVSYDISYACE